MAKKTDAPATQTGDAVFDVANPDKAKPSSSSRPIIVSHKPLMQDPMVKEKTSSENNDVPGPPEVTAGTKKLSSAKRVKITPLNQDDQPDTKHGEQQPAETTAIKDTKPEAAKELQDTKEPNDVGESAAASSAEMPPEADRSHSDTTDTESSDATDETKEEADNGLVDELAKQAAAKKQQKEEDKAVAAQNEKIAELIAAKTYFVPTSQVTKRRVKHGLLVVLLLLAAAAAGVNFAADAGLIELGVEPLTDVISP